MCIRDRFQVFHEIYQVSLYDPYYKTDKAEIELIQTLSDVMLGGIREYLIPLARAWPPKYNVAIADAFSVVTHKAFCDVKAAQQAV